MDFTEDADLTDLRRTVRQVVAPYAGSWFTQRAEERAPTREAWNALGKAGFLGVNVAEEHGGGGAGLLELAVVAEEAAAAGCPQLLMLVSSAINGELLGRYGTPEQQREWLPGMCSGERIMVFAITEPDAGTNTHQITTTARRDGDDWLISGQKYYISGVDVADAILLVARTGTDDRGRALMSLFIVATDAPGLVAQPLPISLPFPERQFTLFFDDVRLPATSLVGTVDEGLKQVFHGLNPERIIGAALGIGVGRNVIDRAVEQARNRDLYGVPIGTHQAVAHPLAQARIEIELAALMTYKAAWLHDRQEPAGEASNMAKYAAAEAAVHAADHAMQVHGGNGLSTELGLVPMWSLARLLKIAPVNREMVLSHIAMHTLGLPRSY